MNTVMRIATAFATGAAAMYFLDPVAGGRRRALVRDKGVAARHGLEDFAEAREMVTRHVEDRPLTASVLTAQAIMMAALYSGDEADRGKTKAPATGTRKRTRAG